MSMISLDLPPPTTPQEYIDIVTDHHNETHLKRFENCITHKKCRNSCDKAIPFVKRMNKLGNQTRVCDPLRWRRHYALRLSNEFEAIMSAGPENATDKQLQAIECFKELLEDTKNTLLRDIGETDARNVSKTEMRHLIRLLSKIFFRDGTMLLDFDWITSTLGRGVYGRYSPPGLNLPKITLSAFSCRTVPDHEHLNGRAIDRLGTLVHELIHAHLDYYACRCPSFWKDVDSLKGHGLAWHRIASSLERNAPRFLQLPLDLGRFDAVRSNWSVPLYWPTKQEVIDWDLEREKMVLQDVMETKPLLMLAYLVNLTLLVVKSKGAMCCGLLRVSLIVSIFAVLLVFHVSLTSRHLIITRIHKYNVLPWRTCSNLLILS